MPLRLYDPSLSQHNLAAIDRECFVKTLLTGTSLKRRLVCFNFMKRLLSDHADFNVAVWLVLFALLLLFFVVSRLCPLLSSLLRLTKFLKYFLARNLVDQNTWHLTKLTVALTELELDFHLGQVWVFR